MSKAQLWETEVRILVSVQPLNGSDGKSQGTGWGGRTSDGVLPAGVRGQ